MDDRKKTYVIQHIFDHFYFKQLKLNPKECTIWIVPHNYMTKKLGLIKSFWLKKGFCIKMWPNKLVYVNSLNLIGIYKTRRELINSLKHQAEIHLVDKSSIFSQLILDLHDNVLLYQFAEYEKYNEKTTVNFTKTGYQFMLSLIFRIKFRIIRRTSSGKRKFDSYPYKGRYFKIVDIKFHQSKPTKSLSKNAVFFGSRFMQWGLNDNELRKLSTKIREIANKKYENIFYIPHPLETDSEFIFCKTYIQNLKLVEEQIISAEDWTTSFSVDQLDTYSIGSTASRIASQLGYRSTVFYRDIFERSETMNEYDKLFDMSEVKYG